MNMKRNSVIVYIPEVTYSPQVIEIVRTNLTDKQIKANEQV